MPVVHARPLTTFVARIFAATGAPADEAHMVAEHLVDANLRGHDSHGVIRTSGYVQAALNGVLRPGARPEVVRQAASTALIDGGWNYGQVVAHFATDVAIAKAQETGAGFVACYASGHIGRVGAYGERMVEAGMIGLGGVNSPGGRLTAAFGGAHRRTGTSPIMFAMPTSDPAAPFVLDMATSVVAEGKLKVAVNQGVQVPDAWIIDSEGRPTNEPRDFYGTGEYPSQGALLPVGGPDRGYKGFGLNLAVEALSGILSTAGTSIEGTRGSNGVWLMALDPARFLPLASFEAGMDALLSFVKEPPYQPGVEEILTAGEPERRRMVERLHSGIALDDETWRQIATAAASVGVGPMDVAELAAN